MFQELCRLLSINQCMSTAYHPRTNGETERVNQELEIYLCWFCSSKPRKWITYLPIAKFAHNNCAHETSKMSPFQIIYGVKLKGIPTSFPWIKAPDNEQRLTELVKIRQEALATHELARQLMVRCSNKPFTPFKENQMVLLEARNLKLPYKSKKMQLK